MRRAFTLIELVVVMAVIGLLVGVLAPQLSGALHTAQRARCLANLGQLGKAVMMYMDQENRGILPACPAYIEKLDNKTYTEVFALLADYLDAPQPQDGPNGVLIPSAVFTCARDRQLAPVTGYSYSYDSGLALAPVWDLAHPDPTWAASWTFFNEQYPADTIVFADAMGWHPESPWAKTPFQKMKNAVYFDGHADWEKPHPFWSKLDGL